MFSRPRAFDGLDGLGAGNVCKQFRPLSKERYIVGQKQRVFGPWTDARLFPADLEHPHVFVIAHARIDQVREQGKVVKVDLERIYVVERGKHCHRPPGCGLPASSHQKDDKLIAAVGFSKNHSVQGSSAPIAQLRVHIWLCLDFAKRTAWSLAFAMGPGLRHTTNRHGSR